MLKYIVLKITICGTYGENILFLWTQALKNWKTLSRSSLCSIKSSYKGIFNTASHNSIAERAKMSKNSPIASWIISDSSWKLKWTHFPLASHGPHFDNRNSFRTSIFCQIDIASSMIRRRVVEFQYRYVIRRSFLKPCTAPVSVEAYEIAVVSVFICI